MFEISTGSIKTHTTAKSKNKIWGKRANPNVYCNVLKALYRGRMKVGAAGAASGVSYYSMETADARRVTISMNIFRRLIGSSPCASPYQRWRCFTFKMMDTGDFDFDFWSWSFVWGLRLWLWVWGWDWDWQRSLPHPLSWIAHTGQTFEMIEVNSCLQLPIYLECFVIWREELLMVMATRGRVDNIIEVQYRWNITSECLSVCLLLDPTDRRTEYIY